MDFINALIEYLQGSFGGGLWVILPFIAFIGIVAQMRLYAKANQPALSAVVPVWNFIVFMKIIGRPVWHAVYFVAPIALMFGALLADYADLFAFSQGAVGFADVSVSLPILGISALVLTVFFIWSHIDLCNSFGRNTVFDYFLMVVLNVLYVLNLGLSYEIGYIGPAYGRPSLHSGSGSEAFA